MSDEPSCLTCKFFKPKSGRDGFCRRFPPSVILKPNDNQPPQMFFLSQLNPWVNCDDWCGEHTVGWK